MPLNKMALRIKMKGKRRSLSHTFKRQAEKKIVQYILQQNFFKCATHIACYYSTPQELSTKLLLQEMLTLNKNCYLPCIHENDLIFSPYASQTKLVPNQYGILEPEIKTIFPTKKIELFFLPLIGFDQYGYRLGQGKAFYDRSLKKHSAFCVGLGFSCQYIAEMPHDDWDLKMNAVITESGCQFF